MLGAQDDLLTVFRQIQAFLSTLLLDGDLGVAEDVEVFGEAGLFLEV